MCVIERGGELGRTEMEERRRKFGNAISDGAGKIGRGCDGEKGMNIESVKPMCQCVDIMYIRNS
jgi:hypothetical protein